MPSHVLYLMLLFIGTSLVLMGVSVPLIRGKIKPNPLYGVRTPKTLSDERIWYPANAYGGRLLFTAGLGQLMATLVLFLIPPIRANFLLYVGLCEAVLLISVLAATIRILSYVKSL